MKKKLRIIGSNVSVEFIGHDVIIPAKIDTGADSSSVWATKISISKDGQLSFVLFDEGFEYYTGEVITRNSYKVASVKSSSGHIEIRYRVEIPVRIARKKIRVLFNLSDRGSHKFPVLIGRRTLANKFLVNVSKREYQPSPAEVTRALNDEMNENPYEFYKKHYKNDH